MKEGTKSYLIGCHQFLLHPLWVLMAWRLEYKSWPCWWELICILLHDIGICGRQYMSNDKAKKGHWIKGARLAGRIVWRWRKTSIIQTSPTSVNEFMYFFELIRRGLDPDAFLLCAGHAPNESGYDRSKLFIPDKRSYLVAPILWEWWNYWIEGFKTTNPIEWRKVVRENLKRKHPMGNHELYLHIKRSPTSSPSAETWMSKKKQDENERELSKWR